MYLPNNQFTFALKNAWKTDVPFYTELICVCLDSLETMAILNTLPNQSQQRVCEWDLPILEESEVKGKSPACEPQGAVLRFCELLWWRSEKKAVQE